MEEYILEYVNENIPKITIVQDLAETLDIGESAIKLMLTIYAGYIIGMLHRRFPYKRNLELQYVILTSISFCLLYWNYGWDMLNLIYCVATQWVILRTFGASARSTAFSFVFQLGYLVRGYAYYSTTEYIIDWTMPHCILTLRMIGLAWDMYDIEHPAKKGDQQQDEDQSPLAERQDPYPSFTEIFGFAFFYPGYIVGPQFSFERFLKVFNGELTDNPGKKPGSKFAALRRGVSGTAILALQAYLDTYFNPQRYLTSEFQDSKMWQKVVYIGITGHVILLRYIAVWMINEGSAILCGLGYRKEIVGGKTKASWDAMRNVALHKFLLACSFQDMINSFNINTNAWVLKYVFKRMRWVGIRSVSQACTMYFLAIWHGLHEGYFTCFTYESLVMFVEKDLVKISNGLKFMRKIRASRLLRWLPKAIGFVYVHLGIGYCLIDFVLLKWDVYQPVYESVNYYGHIFNGIFFVLLAIRSLMLQRPAEKEEKKD